MARRSRGIKRSSWLTFKRRLILIRHLLRQPSSREALMRGVQHELGEHGYPLAAASALKHDLDALKREYACTIRYDRTTHCYVLENLGELSLLDLPDHCIEALLFLDASFPEDAGLPQYTNVRALLERIRVLLPADRMSDLAQQGFMQLQFPGTAPNRIDPSVMATVRRAITQRRELEFRYRDRHDDTQGRTHRVAAYRVLFSPEGHSYLDATLLHVHPAGEEKIHSVISYRLDRIIESSAVMLPRKLPLHRPQPPSYQLTYVLDSSVARRRDVAAYFPHTRINYHDDGSATVTATITNLWQTRQMLLRYGDGCRVLEPPELVAMFAATVQGLQRIYAEHLPDAPA